MSEWKDMRDVTQTILDEIDAKNAKAFYRNLKSLENLKEYEEMKSKYTQFKSQNDNLEADRPEFVDLMKKNDKNLNKYFREQKKMYSKILG